jgi:hypothetical protein
MPNLSPSRRKRCAGLLGVGHRLVEPAVPEPQVGDEGLHHRRGPVVATLERLGLHDAREVLGLDEPALEEADEGQEPERPSDAVAVAEPAVRLGGAVQPLVGHLEIAGHERQPGAVLLDVREAALVADRAVLGLGLAEVPLGVGERPAEQLDEAALAQCVGQEARRLRRGAAGRRCDRARLARPRGRPRGGAANRAADGPRPRR